MKTDFMKALEHQALNEWSDVYLDMYRRLKSGMYHGDYVDTVFQGKGYTPANVLAFANIHHLISIGSIARLTVDVGDTPFGDKAIEQNNRILSGLPKLFEAVFHPEKGYAAWDDGYFSGKGNVIFERTPIAKYQHLARHIVIDLYNQWIPLEVGTTDGHTTYMHLLMDGAVARWAYGSSAITVLLMLNANNQHKGRVWKYHVATPLDIMIARSQGFYIETDAVAEGKAA
jgi:hypothetical protein